MPCPYRALSFADKRPLESFFRAVYNETDEVVSAYINCALSSGRTYVLDAGTDSTFIVSAITVIENEEGVKFLVFGGTIPSLRNKGFFRNVVSFAMEKEKGRFVCFPKNKKMHSFLNELGFTFPSFALECFLSGSLKKPKLHMTSAGSSSIHLIREKHLGDDGFSDEAFFDAYAYFRAKGGQISITGDGYIAYFPTDEKGKYKIVECAVSEKTVLSLSPAFESCILPARRKAEADAAGIEYKMTINALSTFDMGEGFVNPMFRY